MNHVLLLGAGFSRNWGGWLASEAFEYLLGSPELDAGTRALLWADRRSGGFEKTLATLQQQHSQTPSEALKRRLLSLQRAIQSMFDDMDRAFEIVSFEFSNDRAFSIQTYLANFDSIFTLNQDLLLERKYLNDNIGLSLGKSSSWQMPGIKQMESPHSLINGHPGYWTPTSESDFRLEENSQPYFKLHGSSNWRVGAEFPDGLLIIGGDKASLISRSPLLSWYQQQFKNNLMKPQTRLMVIGYSFGDPHINATISEAARSGLEIFIMDPFGSDVIDENRLATIYHPGPLVTALSPQIVGGSRRHLREIFGGDKVEHSKLLRFFRP